MQQSKMLSPEEFVQQIDQALPQSTPTERQRLLKHAEAWATVSYNGEVPAELSAHLRTLGAQWQS